MTEANEKTISIKEEDHNENKTTNEIDMNAYPYVIPTTLKTQLPLICNQCPAYWIPTSPSCYRRPGWQWTPYVPAPADK